MINVHTSDSTRHNSWVRDNYRIDAKEHAVTRTTSRHVTATGGDNDVIAKGNILSPKPTPTSTTPTTKDSNNALFPPHYYPSAFTAPDRHLPMLGGPNGVDLSPRQAQVIHAVLPHRPPPPPRPVVFPEFPSAPLAPQAQSQSQSQSQPPSSPTRPKPDDYVRMVAAQPRIPTRFGNYPELTRTPAPAFAPPASDAAMTVKRREPKKLPPPPERRSSLKLNSSLGPFGTNYYSAPIEDGEANATMETTVSGQSGQPKRVGRWTLAQLRQTDGIIPSQAGWNKGDSQKLMTNFGTPRNTSTRVKAENLAEVPEDVLMRSHGEVRLQSGTNKFCSQRGMTGFGTGRDVCREGVHVNQLPADLEVSESAK